MPVLSSNNLTLADWAKRVDPRGAIPQIAELLSQTNEVLEDMVFKPGNLPTGHREVIRTGLPAVYWRSINQGIAPSKSTTAQVDEALGMLEARSEIDTALADLNGNTNQFRLSEDKAFLEAMNQEQAQTLLYGDPAVDSKEYLGLEKRYSDLSAPNAQNIISLGASANLSSVWLVVWGDQTVFSIFPKGSMAGLTHRNLGEQTVYEAGGAGLRMQAFVSLFTWKTGLVIKDWRYAVRICNIDTDALLAQTAAGPGDAAINQANNLAKKMSQALYRIPNQGAGKACFYMNRKVHSGLAAMAMDKSQNALSIERGTSQFGHPMSWTSFLGVPIRKTDAITNAETQVT